MAYKNLPDEGKLKEAIRFVSIGQPLPEPLKEFLLAEGLYESVITPGVIEQEIFVDDVDEISDPPDNP